MPFFIQVGIQFELSTSTHVRLSYTCIYIFWVGCIGILQTEAQGHVGALFRLTSAVRGVVNIIVKVLF